MTSLIYVALALFFGCAHHFWACNLRSRIAKHLADNISWLGEDWGHHIQNWFVRVFVPIVIVLNQGNTPQVLGFKLPKVNMETFILLILLTVALFLATTVIIWFAISLVKDAKAAEAVKNWPEKLNWRESIVSAFLWTVPEECFLRGYLISQFARFDLTSALIVSALFSGAVHESRGKFWILLTAVSGLSFGPAFAWTDSLLPPFVLHVISNTVYVIIQTPWTTALLRRSS